MPSHELRGSIKPALNGDQASVVQSVNYAIRWINLYPVHGAVRFVNICLLNFDLDRFSIECRKTRAKIVTTAGQKGRKYPEEPMRTKARENAFDQVVIFC